jgi:hypothetical protein
MLAAEAAGARDAEHYTLAVPWQANSHEKLKSNSGVGKTMRLQDSIQRLGYCTEGADTFVYSWRTE